MTLWCEQTTLFTFGNFPSTADFLFIILLIPIIISCSLFPLVNKPCYTWPFSISSCSHILKIQIHKYWPHHIVSVCLDTCFKKKKVEVCKKNSLPKNFLVLCVLLTVDTLGPNKMTQLCKILLLSFTLSLFMTPSHTLASHQTAPDAHLDHVFFRHVGTTIPTLSYVHVAFDLDLLSIRKNLVTLKTAIDREHTFFREFQRIRVFTSPRRSSLRSVSSSQWLTMFHQANTVQTLLDDIDLILSLGTPTHSTTLRHNPHPAFNETISRPKRFLTALALGFTAVASTLFGIFTQGQIHSMQSEIRQLGEQSRTIIDIQHKMLSVLENNTIHLNELQDSFNNLEARLETWSVIHQFSYKSAAIASAITAAAEDVHAVEAIVEAMMRNQVSLKLFKRQTLEDVLTAITNKAAAFGYTPLLTHFADFLQCEASFVYTEQGFSVLMHTPAHLANTALTILEHVPFPIRVHKDLFAEISTKFKFLGVHEESNHFAVFTAQELQACNQRGTAFLCHHHNILQKFDPATAVKDPATCLYALYVQDYHAILNTCDTHLRPAMDKVIQYSEHVFWTYTTRPHQGDIHCPDEKLRRFSADNSAEVTLPTGCTAETNTHMFTAGASLATTHWEYHWGWPQLALQNITQDIDLEGYAALLRTAHPRTRHQIPSEISQIKSELSQLDKSATANGARYSEGFFLRFAIGLVGFVTAATAIYILVRWCRKRRVRRQEASARATISDAGVKVILNAPSASAPPSYPQISDTTPRLPY